MSDALKERLSQLGLDVDELRLILLADVSPNSAADHGDGSRKRQIGGDEDESSHIVKRRGTAACNECRMMKIRCVFDTPGSSMCTRCRSTDLQCVVSKCKRGRVPGSKNKSKAAPGDLTPGTYQSRSGSLGQSTAHVAARKAEDEDPAAPDQDFQLPIEGGSGLPEKEDQYMKDGPHPLYLLSDIGARRGNSPEVLSVMHSPTGATGLNESQIDDEEYVVPGWTRRQFQRAARQKRAYFQHPIAAIKRDSATNLDPINRGLVDETVAQDLVKRFFQWLQPQVGIMDETLHTAAFLRKHSAILLTTVLAISAQTRRQEGDKALSLSLYGHAERLLLLVVSSNAKSPEICAALLLLYLWPKFPKRNLDDRSRILAINMATELELSNLPEDIEGDHLTRRRHRDKVRTYVALYIHDRSLSAFSGRPPMMSNFSYAALLRDWLDKKDIATPGDCMICGYTELRALEYEMRLRLGQVKQPYLVKSLRRSAIAQIEGWCQEWQAKMIDAPPRIYVTMHLVASHIGLLLLSKGLEQDNHSGNQIEMAEFAHRSLTFFLENALEMAPYICRTVATMIAWGAIVLLRLVGSSAREIVRQAGVALAPYGDGRLDLGAAHFYGALLIELSLDETIDVATLHQTGNPCVIPSPSTIWLLRQNGQAAGSTAPDPIDDMSRGIGSLVGFLPGPASELGQVSSFGGVLNSFDTNPPPIENEILASRPIELPFDLDAPLWPDTEYSPLNTRDRFMVDQVTTNLSNTNDVDLDWGWLFQATNVQGNV